MKKLLMVALAAAIPALAGAQSWPDKPLKLSLIHI